LKWTFVRNFTCVSLNLYFKKKNYSWKFGVLAWMWPNWKLYLNIENIANFRKIRIIPPIFVFYIYCTHVHFQKQMSFRYPWDIKQIIPTKNFKMSEFQFLQTKRADVLCLPYPALCLVIVDKKSKMWKVTRQTDLRWAIKK
jgi:hypothetical protein